MSRDINLVSKQKIGAGKRKTIIRLRIGAILSLAFVLISSVLLFLINTLNSPTQIKSEQDGALARISSMNRKAVELNVVTERLLSISEILNSRVKYNDLVSLLFKDKPEDIETSSLLIDQNTISFSVNSISLISINEYLKKIIKITSENKAFSNLTIESLSSNIRSGEYTLLLKVFINGPKN